VTPMICQWLFK